MAEGPGIVFMGTPVFAATILQRLIEAGENILAVYTNPDKPAGRGMETRKSPVKELAERHGLPVFQPENYRSEITVAALRDLKPDFLVVAAYGQILPQNVLDVPAIAPINIHGSLLPEYRGSAPIQRAIAESWRPGACTGVSIMKMVKRMDAGPVYATAETGLAGRTTSDLAAELAEKGASLLLKTLPEIASGRLLPVNQDESRVTYAPPLTKAEGQIDWNRPAAAVDAHIRAMNPWPGAQTTFKLGDKKIPMLIRSGSFRSGRDEIPGQILCSRNGLSISCQDGWYDMEIIQPQGRKEMSSREFANGRRLKEGVAGQAI